MLADYNTSTQINQHRNSNSTQTNFIPILTNIDCSIKSCINQIKYDQFSIFLVKWRVFRNVIILIFFFIVANCPKNILSKLYLSTRYYDYYFFENLFSFCITTTVFFTFYCCIFKWVKCYLLISQIVKIKTIMNRNLKWETMKRNLNH